MSRIDSQVDEARAAYEAARAELVRINTAEDVTAEDDARIPELIDDAEALKARLDELEAAQARMAAFGEPEAPAEPVTRQTVTADFGVNTRGSEDPLDVRSITWDTPVSDLRARIHTALEREDIMRDLEDDRRERMTQVLRAADTEGGKLSRYVIANLAPAYGSAFMKIGAGREHELTSEERHALTVSRAASLTDAAGGYAVPADLDPTLVNAGNGAINPFRAISTVRSTVSDVFQKPNTTQFAFSWDGEAAEVSDDAPTIARTEITMHKAQGSVPFSIEISADWAGFRDEMVQLMADGKDILEATAFATGSGSSQPFGIVTALDANTNVEISMATNGAFGLEDVYSALEALPPRFRMGASWVSALENINRVRQFGTSDNYHGFTVDLTAEGVPAVLGKRWYESSAMTGTLSTAGIQNSVVFGDFSNYYIVDRVGMSVELVPHLLATANNLPNGQRAWYAHWRVGADSVNDNAFRLLQNASS